LILQDGKIVAKADLTDVWTRIQQKAPKADVLNGIAYDAETKKIYITGKTGRNYTRFNSIESFEI
jgi:glutamine cyclotransferase